MQTSRLAAPLALVLLGIAFLLLVIFQAGSSAQTGGSCFIARQRLPAILKEFDSRLPADDRSRADQEIERATNEGFGSAVGYRRVAAAATLAGRRTTAAWAALKSATFDPTPPQTANAGVSLIDAGTPADAQAFLDCAQTEEPDSITVLEARAILAGRLLQWPLATSLIEKAVTFKPRDLNLLYSAGVIHYRAGNIARARDYLRRAQDVRPDDKTVLLAIEIVDPTGASRRPASDDELSRLIRELFDFMDELNVRIQAHATVREDLGEIYKFPSPRETHMRSYAGYVEGIKVRIRADELRMRATQTSVNREYAPLSWNQFVGDVVASYFSAIHEYGFRISTPDLEADLFMATVLGMDPRMLVREMVKWRNLTGLYSDGERYLYRGADGEYDDARNRLDSMDCGLTVPLWTRLYETTAGNTRDATGKFPRAAAAEMMRWLALADRSRTFAAKGVRLLRPVQPAILAQFQGAGGPETTVRNIQASYQVNVAATLKLQGVWVSLLKESIIDEGPGLLISIRKAYPDQPQPPHRSCGEPPAEELKAVEALAELLEAIYDAGEYSAGFKPACELSLGRWTMTLDFNDTEIKLSMESDGGWETEVGRGAISVSASKDGNYGPVRGELEGSIWAEGTKGGDFGAQFTAKVGLGYKEEINDVKIGGVCYLFEGDAKISIRKLSERLLPK